MTTHDQTVFPTTDGNLPTNAATTSFVTMLWLMANVLKDENDPRYKACQEVADMLHTLMDGMGISVERNQ